MTVNVGVKLVECKKYSPNTCVIRQLHTHARAHSHYMGRFGMAAQRLFGHGKLGLFPASHDRENQHLYVPHTPPTALGTTQQKHGADSKETNLQLSI